MVVGFESITHNTYIYINGCWLLGSIRSHYPPYPQIDRWLLAVGFDTEPLPTLPTNIFMVVWFNTYPLPTLPIDRLMAVGFDLGPYW